MVVMSPLAVWLGRTIAERALLIGVFLVVIIVELLNSALEAAVDRHGDEHHELSGRAKDLGSAAVFVSTASFAFGKSLFAPYQSRTLTCASSGISTELPSSYSTR